MAPGYKFSTMSYNPLDIIKACKEYLSNGKIKTQIRPYIPTVKSSNWSWDETNKCWINVGEWKYVKTKDIMSITDLPYDIDFDTFEKMLNKYAESGYIKDWKNFSQGTNIHYDIHFPKGTLAKEIGRASVDTKLPNKFKLIKKMPDDLLWVLDENGKVKHFASVNDLITYFVDFRLKKYDDRKDRLVKVLREKLKQNTDICKFIELVITGKIEIRNRKRADIKAELKPYDLPDSLLSYPMAKLTKEEYDALLKENQDIQKELQYVIDTTTKDMYLNDLNALNKCLKDDFVD
jgi:DNA topoisomerase-2